ncbi:MAG: hypothetical protein GF401_01115 [Chitinivibrionales bacterium]|nr:hypothetical protein [Chitinivibrionales bacterium]
MFFKFNEVATKMRYTSPFPELSRLILGTQGLGCSFDSTADSVALARAAMDAGLAFHTSHMYNHGQALNILKLAFREDPSNIPPVMGKVYCYNATQIRFDVEEMLERLHIDQLTIGQLAKNDHRHREIVDDILSQGPMFEMLCALREKGMVGHWTFEIFQKFSHDAFKAIDNDLFSSAAFYFNALERETDIPTWEQIKQKNMPIIAVRGLSGGLVEPSNEHLAGKPGKPAEIIDRRKELTRLFEKSGCSSWSEFSIRYLHSVSNVQSIVIGTSKQKRLQENIALTNNAKPLDRDIVSGIDKLQNTWAAGRTFDPNSPYV